MKKELRERLLTLVNSLLDYSLSDDAIDRTLKEMSDLLQPRPRGRPVGWRKPKEVILYKASTGIEFPGSEM